MLRSFHYAADTVFVTRVVDRLASADEAAAIETWGQFWQDWVSSAFLKAYLNDMADTGLLPANEEDLKLLLNIYLLDKAIYELAYELNNRPDWVWIPLKGIRQLLETS